MLTSCLCCVCAARVGILPKPQSALQMVDNKARHFITFNRLLFSVLHFGVADGLTPRYCQTARKRTCAAFGAIPRSLLTRGEQGGDAFFGEPMLDINDLMQTVTAKASSTF